MPIDKRIGQALADQSAVGCDKSAPTARCRIIASICIIGTYEATYRYKVSSWFALPINQTAVALAGSVGVAPRNIPWAGGEGN